MEVWMIIIGVILLFCIAEWIREIVTFEVTHYSITSEKLSGLERERTILFLTDLHSNCYGKNNVRLLTAIRRQHPDLILIGGDMLVGIPHADTSVATGFVKQLTEICPVYYANGNHEQRMKLYPERYGDLYQEYKQALVASRVHFLENEGVSFWWDSCQVELRGLEIPAECFKKFRKTELAVDQVNARIGEAQECKYQILLAHNPIYADTYLDWGADLVLSGHLHGGVVRIPGIGGIVTPQFRLFPKYSGELTTRGERAVVVSKGLGAHTIKLRLFNPAELVVLHLGKR